MNFNQLQVFREVMLTGSVSGAGRNLHRTQPAITATIAALEKSVGFALFSRSGGRLHPCPEAYYLLDEANVILDRLASVERTLKNLRELKQGNIRVVSMPGPASFLLPALISDFVGECENIKVELLSRSSPQVQQLVSVQQYDVGIADIGLDGVVESPLVSQQVYKLECVCAMRREDPLASQSCIEPQDLDGRSLAALYDPHPTTLQTRRVFENAGKLFHIGFEAQYFIPILTFVERQLAYSIIDPLSAESYQLYRGNSGVLVFRPFRPTIYLMVAILTPVHRPLSQLAQGFVGQLKQEVTDIANRYAVRL